MNYKRLYTLAAIVSWLLLVGTTLFLSRSVAAGNTPEVAVWLHRFLKAGFILLTFMSQRISVEHYRGTDFTGYLGKLFLRAGSTVYVGMALYLGYYYSAQYLPALPPGLIQVIYLLSFAFLTYFLGKAFYI